MGRSLAGGGTRRRTPASETTAPVDVLLGTRNAWLRLRIREQDREPGAILGARPRGQPRTITDVHGNTSAVLSVKADLPDQSERLVATYGSEGWGNPSGAPVFTLVSSLSPVQFGCRTRQKGLIDSDADSNAVQFG
jgi:hypothetical protein